MFSIVQMPISLKLFLVSSLNDIDFVELIIFLLMLVSNSNKFFPLNVFDNNLEHVLNKFNKIFSQKKRKFSFTFMNIFPSSIFNISKPCIITNSL
jgi:hypothetical protein